MLFELLLGAACPDTEPRPSFAPSKRNQNAFARYAMAIDRKVAYQKNGGPMLARRVYSAWKYKVLGVSAKRASSGVAALRRRR